MLLRENGKEKLVDIVPKSLRRPECSDCGVLQPWWGNDMLFCTSRRVQPLLAADVVVGVGGLSQQYKFLRSISLERAKHSCSASFGRQDQRRVSEQQEP